LLYRYSEVFRTLLVVADASLVSGAWLAAWWLSVQAGWIRPEPGLRAHATLLLATLPMFLLLIRGQGLYQPQRTGSLLREAGAVIRVTAMAVVLLVALTFFAGSPFQSRAVVAVFSVLAPIGIIGFRTAGRLGLRALRRRGLNQRFVLVLGAGRLAEEIIQRIHAHPEAGLQVLGVLADQGRGARQEVAGIPVLGGLAQLKEVLDGPDRVDQVILALPQDEAHAHEKVLADLDDEMVSVKLVPDLLRVMTLRSTLESLDGLPIIGLRETPMVGWAVVKKRGFDLVVCAALAPPALIAGAAIGLAVWISNGRPVLYTQDRTGLDGRVFRMGKFRSMRRDAERETGPVWSTSRENDPAGRLAAENEPRRAAPAAERAAGRHEPGGAAAGTPGLHRGVQARYSRLHASPQGEGGNDRLGPGPRLARRHVPARAGRTRPLLHPELVRGPRHPDHLDDPVPEPPQTELGA
jgi:hypothetical protein